MKCESLQLNLPLYTDNDLSSQERTVLDEHLADCPVCRQRLDEYRDLRQNLMSFARPAIPVGITNSVRLAVAAAAEQQNTPVAENAWRKWSNRWLVPSSVGAFGSIIVAVFFIWALAINSVGGPTYSLTRQGGPDRMAGGDELPLTPSQYAEQRLAFAGESPSLNPNGALVALSKSLVRGKMKDDEVVVVADVFGDGLARISGVIEPSHNKRAVEELDEALRSDPDYAPFVPANFDKRSDSIRVVLKFHTVDVKTNLSPQ